MDSSVRTYVIWGVGLLAMLALILAIIAMNSGSKSSGSGSSSGGGGSGSGGGSGGSVSSYVPFAQRCAAAMNAFPTTALAINTMMPGIARAEWQQEVSGGAFSPEMTDLPTWVTSMANGSPMPQQLACLLIDGCSAGRWTQSTPDGTCYTTSPSAGGWAPCPAGSVTPTAQQQLSAALLMACQQ